MGHGCNGDRNEWSPIQSVIIPVTAKRESALSTEIVIIDRIGRHEDLPQIYHNRYNFRIKITFRANIFGREDVYSKNIPLFWKFPVFSRMSGFCYGYCDQFCDWWI